MFAGKWITTFKKAYLPSGRVKKARMGRVDVMAEQVKKILQTTDQKLILMVRG